MAGKTREIRGRIKAVGNIKRITRTMQMIATARFQAMQKRATATRPFTRKITELVGELAHVATSAGASFSHPLLKPPDPAVGRELLLVLSSNRGLCGGYNANVLRTALAYIRENADRKIDLEVVGKKGLAFFKFSRIGVSKFHGQFTDQPRLEEVQRLADEYMSVFTSGQYDSVKVIYMAFESMSRQRPAILPLLPLQDPTKSVGGEVSGKPVVDYDFSPDPLTLMNELLPVTVRMQLFQCFNEAVVSEQIARMVAMKSATDNAGQMSRELSRQYNRARQTAITTELMEVISGAAALD